MMLKISTVLFLLFSVSVFALYCPNCGTNNRDHWRHCVRCGESLEEARKVLSSKDIRPPQTLQKSNSLAESSDVRTLHYHNSTKAKVFQGTPGLNATEHSEVIKQVTQQGMTPIQLQQFIQNNTAQQLLRLQNQNIGESQFSALQADPQVQQLVNQMKSRQFQGQLMQGLKNLQRDLGGGNKAKLGDQMRQLESLFQLLNQQSAIAEDLEQP